MARRRASLGAPVVAHPLPAQRLVLPLHRPAALRGGPRALRPRAVRRPARWTRPWTNRRTGEVRQVPVGIDPGFDRNVGLVDPVARARSMLREKAAAAVPAVAWLVAENIGAGVAHGRRVRKRAVEAAGRDPDAFGFARRFLDAVIAILQAERGAGTVTAQVSTIVERNEHRIAARQIREASRLFPASWIRKANETPLKAAWRGTLSGGSHAAAWRAGPALVDGKAVHKDIGETWVLVSGGLETALHEYMHHLQAAMPDLDGLFQQLHRRRTKGEPLLPLKDYLPDEGRKDRYVDEYFGK